MGEEARRRGWRPRKEDKKEPAAPSESSILLKYYN
jgi:hypothetical protein